MWTWSQRGAMYRNGRFLCPGYSGHGQGVNNPAFQTIKSVGPLPTGKWKIVQLRPENGPHGPYVLVLQPEPGTVTFGRGGFLIHGDSVEHPGEASEGCIILPRTVRELIWLSGDRELEVVSADPPTTVTT